MDRIAELVERLEMREPSPAREDARELVTEVLAFHGEGLRRLVDSLRKQSSIALGEALKDPLVASLFELHDLKLEAPPALLPASDLLKKTKGVHGRAVDEDEVVCDLCAAPAASDHAHLFNVEDKTLHCVCQACAVVMSAHERLRRVPERRERVTSLEADDDWWTALGLPIGIAFLVAPPADAAEVEVQYPGAVGTVVSTIPRALWSEITRAHPLVLSMEPEVEVLLVNRTWGAREHWVVGIDQAYELAGLIRQRWRGFTGGDEVRTELMRFFGALA